MSRELPTTLFRTLTSSSRSVFERDRGDNADADIRAGRHALIARMPRPKPLYMVWLVRLTQMSRTRSCPNRRLVCLALESPPDDVAFEMPPIGTVSAHPNWRNWYNAMAARGPHRLKPVF